MTAETPEVRTRLIAELRQWADAIDGTVRAIHDLEANLDGSSLPKKAMLLREAADALAAEEWQDIVKGEATMSVLTDESVVWYGPHACESCGSEIVRAARENGGESFDVPAHLMRVFRRGAEAGNPDIAYPTMWKPHTCVPRENSALPAPPDRSRER